MSEQQALSAWFQPQGAACNVSVGMTKTLACGCLACFENGKWITLVKCV